MPFSRGTSQPRDRTLVSCIAGRSFTVWATKEVAPQEPRVFTKEERESEGAQSCPTPSMPWTVAHQAPPSMGLGKNTGVGCHFL